MKIYYWDDTPVNYGNGQTWVVANSVEEARAFAIAYFKDNSEWHKDETIAILTRDEPKEIEIVPGVIMVDRGYDG